MRGQSYRLHATADHQSYVSSEGERFAATALAAHVSYLVGETAMAVVRTATIHDRVAVARLVTREDIEAGVAAKSRRRGLIREMLEALQDRRMLVHVVEVNGRLCAAVRLNLVGKGRIFASSAVVNEAGQAFDLSLPLRMAEHAVHCCQIDGWTELGYLLDLEGEGEAEAVCDNFRRLGYDCRIRPAPVGLGERLRFGRRSHEIRFTFPKAKQGSDSSDPHIVWC